MPTVESRTPDPPVTTDNTWRRDILVLTLLLGLLFGFALGHRALWHPDEGRYVEIPREMVQSGDYVTPRLNGVKYFEKPVLFAIMGCLALYAAGRRLPPA